MFQYSPDWADRSWEIHPDQQPVQSDSLRDCGVIRVGDERGEVLPGLLQHRKADAICQRDRHTG